MHSWPRLAEAAVEVRAPAVGRERSRPPRAPAHKQSHTRAQAHTHTRMACWVRTHLRLPSPSPPALNPLRSEAIRFAWPRAARWETTSSFRAKTPTGEPYSQPRNRTCTRVCFSPHFRSSEARFVLILRTRFVTVTDAQTYSYRGMRFRFGVTNPKCARVFFRVFRACAVL